MTGESLQVHWYPGFYLIGFVIFIQMSVFLRERVLLLECSDVLCLALGYHAIRTTN